MGEKIRFYNCHPDPRERGDDWGDECESIQNQIKKRNNKL